MREIVDYLVVNSSASSISATVKMHLVNGWQPYGFPVRTGSDFNQTLAQAMVKYRPETSAKTGPRLEEMHHPV